MTHLRRLHPRYGGETSLAITILLCRRHHRLVHEGGTRMALELAALEAVA